jgi:hypothetical protein
MAPDYEDDSELSDVISESDYEVIQLKKAFTENWFSKTTSSWVW